MTADARTVVREAIRAEGIAQPPDTYAAAALAGLRAAGFVVIHKDDTREDCEDPWVCCVHYLTSEERANA